MTIQTKTEVKYDRMFEIFTEQKYDEAMGLVSLQVSKRGTQTHQDIVEAMIGEKRFTYQTLDGTATIRVSTKKRTIELSTLVDEELSNGIKKVLEIN